VNKILINLNEKLNRMCDVRNMSYVTKQSIGFVCHPPFKSHSWHRTDIYDNVEASCYVEMWSANAICHGIFRSFWLGVTVYCMLCVLVWSSCTTCCNVCVLNSELLLQDQGK